MGIPYNRWFIMKNPTKWMIWGTPFQETHIYGGCSLAMLARPRAQNSTDSSLTDLSEFERFSAPQIHLFAGFSSVKLDFDTSLNACGRSCLFTFLDIMFRIYTYVMYIIDHAHIWYTFWYIMPSKSRPHAQQHIDLVVGVIASMPLLQHPKRPMMNICTMLDSLYIMVCMCIWYTYIYIYYYTIHIHLIYPSNIPI